MRRQGESFNDSWLYCAGNLPHMERSDIDDSCWSKIDLPHDWSIGQPFDSTLPQGARHAYLPYGVVNYRKHFHYEPKPGERVILDFDGAYRAPDLFVNGRHILKRLNGYVGFEADITDALVPGENLIALRVDNSIEGTSRWYTGSGINRNVWLRKSGTLHFLRHGLWVQPEMDGKVRIAVETSKPGDVRHAVSDPSGQVVAEGTGSSCDLSCPSPLLWSPDSPHLYRCVSTLFDEAGEAVDRIESRFGFRSVEFSPDKGLIFNGEKLLLRGVNIHEELCGVGCAVFREGIRRRYRVLKSLGVNAIRLAHHPYAPEFLELADEMGFLVFDELFDKWTGQFYGFQADFEQQWPDDLTEFIRRDRNHPCVFLWSAGNEMVDQQLEGRDHFGVDLFRRMRDRIRELDPTRPVTCALYPARKGGIMHYHPDFFGSNDIHQLAHEMDVVSANYMGRFFRRDHEKYPDMVFLVSEATTNHGAGSWFEFDHEIGVGSFYWGGFDYLGEAPWPHKNWYSGLIDRAGFPKPAAYQAQVAWDDTPRVYAAVHADSGAETRNWNDVQLVWENMRSHWNFTPGETVRLAVYTNCERVEIYLNGKKLAGKDRQENDCCRIPFELEFVPGELVIRGFNGAEIAAEHILQTAGEPAELRLTAPQPGIADDLVHVETELVDAAGIRCVNADSIVCLSVKGDGILYSVSNGDTTSAQQFKTDAVRLFEGRALAVLRTGKVPGKMKLLAEADSLQAKITLDFQ